MFGHYSLLKALKLQVCEDFYIVILFDTLTTSFCCRESVNGNLASCADKRAEVPSHELTLSLSFTTRPYQLCLSYR